MHHRILRTVDAGVLSDISLELKVPLGRLQIGLRARVAYGQG